MALAGLLLLTPCASPGQTVPRTDTPRQGEIRLTFNARIETWAAQFLDGNRTSLGAALTGDPVGGPFIPAVARLERDVRTGSRVPTFVASLGRGQLSVHSERRTTPLGLEFGLTDRLALGVTVPLVRVSVRTSIRFNDDSTATLGLNPLIGDRALDTAYVGFFGQFDAALARLDANIAAGAYGCPSSPQCAQARALSADGHGVQDALRRSVYGPGGAPFLPVDTSAGGRGIASNVARIQQELATSFGVAGFTRRFLLPTAAVSGTSFPLALADSLYGFGVAPFRNTRLRHRYWLGDAEVTLRYRLVSSPAYSALGALVVRLPTGHLDSPHDVLDLPTGDHQTDLEAQLVQEATVGRRLWLNLSLRAARQQRGTRERRVALAPAFLVSRSASSRLSWDPGEYAAADFAPLYRFSPYFAAGVTVGYWHRGSDRYSFLAPQDSIDLATRLGAPTPASVLDAGTAERRVRLGAALTYVGPVVEAGVTIEQTVSAETPGGAGSVPAGTVFRILLRTSRKLF